MEACMRKLALWLTKTFKPLMTHDELEPIMSTLGFVALPDSGGWKEYVFSAPFCTRFKSEPPTSSLPRPRLPYPRIDGLHIYTYRAFLDAVDFYIDMCDISDLFHVRGMPLYRTEDKKRKWRRMEEEESVFVYREGTLEQSTFDSYHFAKQQNNSNNGSGDCQSSDNKSSVFFRDKGKNTPVTSVVPFEDICCPISC